MIELDQYAEEIAVAIAHCVKPLPEHLQPLCREIGIFNANMAMIIAKGGIPNLVSAMLKITVASFSASLVNMAEPRFQEELERAIGALMMEVTTIQSKYSILLASTGGADQEAQDFLAKFKL